MGHSADGWRLGLNCNGRFAPEAARHRSTRRETTALLRNMIAHRPAALDIGAGDRDRAALRHRVPAQHGKAVMTGSRPSTSTMSTAGIRTFCHGSMPRNRMQFVSRNSNTPMRLRASDSIDLYAQRQPARTEEQFQSGYAISNRAAGPSARCTFSRCDRRRPAIGRPPLHGT
jgi:hypothetical protein